MVITIKIDSTIQILLSAFNVKRKIRSVIKVTSTNINSPQANKPFVFILGYDAFGVRNK